MRGPPSSQAVPTPPVIRFKDCLAKTFKGADGKKLPGRTVLEHSLIVGRVAEALLKRMPFWLSTALFSPSAPLVAAAHDVGKVSPYFYEKLRRACLKGTTPLPGLYAGMNEMQWGGHAGASQAAALQAGLSPSVANILGRHHGWTPPGGLRGTDQRIGGETWQKERECLFATLKEAFSCDWPQNFSDDAQVLALSGLVTVSDWIGSNSFFEDPGQDWQSRIESALDAAGFVSAKIKKGLSFGEVFKNFAPHPVQTLFIEQIAGEGVYVLEAPMGLGKTEAALYAAYRLLEKGLAHGIYFALPTQLTSNKLHERFVEFLKTVLEQDSPHCKALLLHGNAHLIDTEMGEEGSPGGSWFNQRKRGLLAPFAVGTLDQALMAVMNVRHGFVRAFGLAGKVVILDEVHTYDAYTGTLLDALITRLRQLHCTVIVLSATLNHARREGLLETSLQSQDYPLITALAKDSPVKEMTAPVARHLKIAIRQTGDESQAIEEALRRAEAGQQVLWIENTVGEAQKRYLDFASRARAMGVDCGLLHSRFTQAHREEKESKWVALFGKEGWNVRSKCGRLLIGTQVLEQSLDIDADFLVSRFAPTDMLLQRLGRLWRHAETPRPSEARPEAWLIVPGLDAAIDSPLTAFGKSAYVYNPYVLCRSLEVWQERESVKLPEDIRALIEATYIDRDEQGNMQRWLNELENGSRRPARKGRSALRQFANIALATLGNTLPESKAETRYSEQQSVEVLLLRALSVDKDKKLTRLTLLSGEQVDLPWNRHPLDTTDWRKLTVQLMRQQVKIPLHSAPGALPQNQLERWGFQHCFYLGNPAFEEYDALFRVARVDKESDRIVSLQDGERTHEDYDLDYRDDIGYRAERL